MSDDRKRLSEWVDKALNKKSGKTTKGLAAALNLDPAQVSRMRSGERAIKAHELRLIETYIGERAPGYGPADAGAVVPLAGNAVSILEIEVLVAPHVWRERGMPIIGREQATTLPDKDLAGLRQYACAVEAEPGRTVICVPYSSVRTHPHDGDLVHVVRIKGDLEEHTLKLVKNDEGTFFLHPELDGHTTVKPIKFPSHNKCIEVRGLVVADQYRRRH